MRRFLGALSNPERRFPGVLIAGTNGKGSTAATLASILRAAGYRVGLYTSPHLMRVNERIRVSGEPISGKRINLEQISDVEFGEIHERVDKIAANLVAAGSLPWHPSFFEMLTAIAFEYFAQKKVDIAVLEVGMGGRLDATNVIEPRISVITDVALDHQKFLGNTVGEIAREKAGIIRADGVLVTLPQHPEANDVIGNTILECHAKGVSAVPYVPPVSPGAERASATRASTARYRKSAPKSHAIGTESMPMNPVRGVAIAESKFADGGFGYPLSVIGEEIQVESPLKGRHQLRNVALAIAAAVELNAQGFNITPAQIERGIRETQWPARFQAVPATTTSPEFVLDAAHNPAGAWALRSALSERYGERPFTLIFGAMRDKAIGEMSEILFPIAERVIATRAENPRSAMPEEIRQAASRTSAEIVCAENVAAAIVLARVRAGQNGLVVIAGSIYVVGEAMRELGVSA